MFDLNLSVDEQNVAENNFNPIVDNIVFYDLIEDTNQDVDIHSLNLINDYRSIQGVATDVDVHHQASNIYIPDVHDSLKPVKDMEFPIIEHAYDFYAKYAKAGGFSIRKGTSDVRRGVLRLKYFVCYKEGFKPFKAGSESSNKSGKSRKRPSIRTGCLAHIKLTSEDGKTFKVYGFVKAHNHPFVHESDIHFLAANRKLTHTQEDIICELSSLNMGPVKAFNIMKTKYGGFEHVGATATDCKNFKGGLNSFNGEHDADMIVSMLRDKKKYLPDFSFEYSVDQKNALTGLFWADALYKRNYMEFGDVISFDATFNTNKYKMQYEVFQNSRHKLCMWHIMKKVSDKVGSALCSDDEFKRRMCAIG